MQVYFLFDLYLVSARERTHQDCLSCLSVYGTTVRTVLVVAYINFVFSWGVGAVWRGVYYKFLIGFLCMNNAALCRQQQQQQQWPASRRGCSSGGCGGFAATVQLCVRSTLCVCVCVPESWVRVLRLS